MDLKQRMETGGKILQMVVMLASEAVKNTCAVIPADAGIQPIKHFGQKQANIYYGEC
jgi:hypothetical protein